MLSYPEKLMFQSYCSSCAVELLAQRSVAVSWGPSLTGVGGSSLGVGTGLCWGAMKVTNVYCATLGLGVVGFFSEALMGIKSCNAVSWGKPKAHHWDNEGTVCVGCGRVGRGLIGRSRGGTGSHATVLVSDSCAC